MSKSLPTYPESLVLLYSGGLDSTVLLHLAQAMGFNVQALLVDYGQKHRRELEAAKRICESRGVPYILSVVDLSSIKSKLTTPDYTKKYENVSEWHVPGRNTIFIGLALALAETIGAKRIWIGANFEDRINVFPDCSQEYVYAINQVTAQAASYPIVVEAPLLGFRKASVRQIASFLNVNEEDTHSGYAE